MNKTAHDSEILADGQQVFTAVAFIHHEFDGVQKVFLPKRAATKKFLPDVFELPGGHIDFGEDIVAGLVREVNEEFGMSIAVGDPFAVFTYTNDIKRSHSIEVVYFAQFTDPITNIVLDPSDHSEYVWLAEDELSQAYTNQKGADDIEIQAIKKGFALLNGKRLEF